MKSPTLRADLSVPSVFTHINTEVELKPFTVNIKTPFTPKAAPNGLEFRDNSNSKVEKTCTKSITQFQTALLILVLCKLPLIMLKKLILFLMLHHPTDSGSPFFIVLQNIFLAIIHTQI